MTGRLTTSSQQGKDSLTTTSTTSNRYAGLVMEGNKTGYSKESPGAILDTARARVKTEGGSYWAGHRRSLLALRRKPKHRATWVRYGWRSQLLWIRLTWRSHWRPELQKKIAKLKNFLTNK
jgi:hypothetical protein